MNLKDNIKKYAPDFIRATVISFLVGATCGLIGTAFVKSISFVTNLRENNTWILYLLPVFGLFLTFIYKELKELVFKKSLENSVSAETDATYLAALVFNNIFSLISEK